MHFIGHKRQSFIPKKHRRKRRRGNASYSGVNTGWDGLPVERGEGINKKDWYYALPDITYDKLTRKNE